MNSTWILNKYWQLVPGITRNRSPMKIFPSMSNKISPILITRFLAKKTFASLFLKHWRKGEEKNTGNWQAFCIIHKRKKNKTHTHSQESWARLLVKGEKTENILGSSKETTTFGTLYWVNIVTRKYKRQDCSITLFANCMMSRFHYLATKWSNNYTAYWKMISDHISWKFQKTLLTMRQCSISWKNLRLFLIWVTTIPLKKPNSKFCALQNIFAARRSQNQRLSEPLIAHLHCLTFINFIYLYN